MALVASSRALQFAQSLLRSLYQGVKVVVELYSFTQAMIAIREYLKENLPEPVIEFCSSVVNKCYEMCSYAKESIRGYLKDSNTLLGNNYYIYQEYLACPGSW